MAVSPSCPPAHRGPAPPAPPPAAPSHTPRCDGRLSSAGTPAALSHRVPSPPNSKAFGSKAHPSSRKPGRAGFSTHRPGLGLHVSSPLLRAAGGAGSSSWKARSQEASRRVSRRGLAPPGGGGGGCSGAVSEPGELAWGAGEAGCAAAVALCASPGGAGRWHGRRALRLPAAAAARWVDGRTTARTASGGGRAAEAKERRTVPGLESRPLGSATVRGLRGLPKAGSKTGRQFPLANSAPTPGSTRRSGGRPWSQHLSLSLSLIPAREGGAAQSRPLVG